MRRRRVEPRPVRAPRIVHEDDRTHLWLWLLLLPLLAAGFWQAYRFGLERGGFDAQRAAAEKAQLDAELQRQGALLEEYRAESARYRRQAEVAEGAAQALQETLDRLEAEKARLQSEVKMLKELIASDAGSLYVRDFTIEPLADAQRYRYRFTLVQVKEQVEQTKGKLVMKLVGRQDGKRKILDRAQFAPDGEKVVKLAFKHYQDIQGEAQLPEGFQPIELRIEFFPRNKGLKKLKAVFPWSMESAHGAHEKT